MIEPITDSIAESIRIEGEAVAAAESKDYAKALLALDRAIALTANNNRASLFNNRAQTYRLMGNDKGANFYF